MGVVFITCDRYDDAAGTSLPAAYVGNSVGDGYAYFNDFDYFRVWMTNDNYKGSVEVYYQDKKRWVLTSNVDNIKVYNFNILNTISTMFGSTSLPLGGQGVEDACKYAIEIAENPGHGYHMDATARDQGVDFDCSSFVAWSFRHGGGFNIPSGPDGTSPTTYYMIYYYTQAGFTWIPGIANDSSNLMRGDILLFEGDINIGTGHTAIYLGNGEIIEAYGDETNGTDVPVEGDQKQQWGVKPWEIGINPYRTGWDGVLRYTGGNEVEII